MMKTTQTLIALVGILGASLPALSQTAVRTHSDSPKSAPVFADLASFYASLPVVDPHPFDKATALQLSAMPLSCMDHPQPRPNAAPYLWEATYTPVPTMKRPVPFMAATIGIRRSTRRGRL